MKITKIVLNGEADNDYITVEDNDGSSYELATVVESDEISELLAALTDKGAVKIAAVK